MPTYQRRDLLADQDIGSPGPLPAELEGLADSSLADLSAALDSEACAALGYVGQGFVPMTEPAPSPSVRNLSRIAFMQRLGAAKRIAIRTAAKTDVIVEDFLDLLSATDLVDLDHADTLAGVGYLVSQTLLTEQEGSALLA